MTIGQMPLTPDDLEYLDLKQAALICCVSDERFASWIKKGVIPIFEMNGKRLIHSHDLIQHLVRHNIPIPDRLLQGNSKKILFVLTDENIPQNIVNEVIWTLYRIRKSTSHIFDFVQSEENIDLKIITLRPDIIFLLSKNLTEDECAVLVKKMGSGATPVHLFSPDRKIDIEMLLSP
jgi:hypothetical protein